MDWKVLQVDFTSEDHRRALTGLLDGYARLPVGQGKSLGAERLAAIWRALGERSWVHAFLAFEHGEPVALAICLEGFSTFQCAPLLNIHDFYVADAYQGQGVGKRFLHAVADTAERLGFCKITLEVLESNLPAKALYRRLGFAPYHNETAGNAEFWQKALTPLSDSPIT
ncbi:N-acetyltransferase family protein [Acidithiobacillus sp. IBUN Pt1247-S3]|uniref:GNAT family N-acetyltransferase n=1 Tax=Acidithiobacillus sp. IBUN Pt1247-S3 TaxID=3166642 RepID=UPI0034E47286